jgi:hypothetical protein
MVRKGRSAHFACYILTQCVVSDLRVTLRMFEDKRLLCCNEGAGIMLLAEDEVRQPGTSKERHLPHTHTHGPPVSHGAYYTVHPLSHCGMLCVSFVLFMNVLWLIYQMTHRQRATGAPSGALCRKVCTYL